MFFILKTPKGKPVGFLQLKAKDS